jgi:phosphate transport system substrate-binding protein
MTLSRLRSISIALFSLLLLAGCGGGRSGAVTVKGSDTMVILGQRWAETYMSEHSGAVIQVTGGGSGTGIAALINGTTDICQASRQMKDAEHEQLKAKYGDPGHELMVAKDGLAVYLNEKNPISEMSIPQLKSIYTREVTNWKQVGGPDLPITVYGRENSSGTYEFFKEHVLGGDDFAAEVQTLPGTAAVVNAVAADAGGIGYGGAAYAKGVHDCAVKQTDDSPAVLPNADTVRDGSYPIARGLYYYTRKAPTGAEKAFIDYVLSPEGQKLVTEVGYFPIG